MHNLLQTFDEDCQEISKTASTIIRRLAGADEVSSPAFYNQAIRDVSALELKWGKHLQFLSAISLATRAQNPALAPTLTRLEMDAADIAEQLRARSSAGWARTPELGVLVVRLRIADTLTSLLQLVEEEKICVRALLQQPILDCTAAALRELAAA